MVKTSQNDNNNKKQPTTTAISLLVEHYRQPIHYRDDKTFIASTHYDLRDAGNIISSPPPIPAIIQHQLDSLTKKTTALPDNDDKDVVGTFLEIMEAYEISIRSEFLVSSKHQVVRRGVAVLTHYEILLSSFFETAVLVVKDEENDDSDFATHSTSMPDDRQQEATRSLSTTIEIVACDITYSTAIIVQDHEEGDKKKNNKEEVSSFLRSNVVLPTLMRILRCLLRFSLTVDIAIETKVLCRCACSLLAFGKTHLSCQELDPHVIRIHCCNVVAIPTLAKMIESEGLIIRNQMWESLTLHATDWEDNTTGIASYAADLVWEVLGTIVDRKDEEGSRNREGEQRRTVISGLGVVNVTRAVRAHFFGRDMPLEAQMVKRRTRLHLGHTMTEPVEPVDKPYRLIPSRLHVACHFFSFTQRIQTTILDEILPICYELLSSPSDLVQGMAAMALCHLLHCSGSSARVWVPYADNILCLLDMIIKTCRHGPTLALAGMAQRSLFSILSTPGQPNEYSQRRREATQQWLVIVDRNHHRIATSHNLVLGVLVGAIIPLLHDHCHQENADALEVGRLGLSALLPLLRCEEHELDGLDDDVIGMMSNFGGGGGGGGADLKLAALVALSNLIIAAHPIIPRHTGKLLCALLALAGHASSGEFPKLRGLRDVTVHVTALAVAVCGDTGRDYLDRLSSSSYNSHLRDIMKDVSEDVDRLVAIS